MKKDPPRHEEPPPALFRDRARRLRREATEAENKLWSHLRNRGVGVKFRRQYPIGDFVVDFVAKLILEVDGGQHDRGADRAKDAQRTRYLAGRGYRILRFWNNEVLNDIDSVLTRIADFL